MTINGFHAPDESLADHPELYEPGDPNGYPGKAELAEFLRPCWDHLTTMADAARLLYEFPGELVIAYDPSAQDAATIYAVTATGRLDNGTEKLQAMFRAVSDAYLLAANNAKGLAPAEFGQITKAARALQDPRALQPVREIMPGTCAVLRQRDLLPPPLVIQHPRDIDEDLSVLGVANGVVDLATARLLPPDEARQHFVSANTHVEYCPEAEHPAVDEMMPENAQSPEQRFWYAYRGYMLACPVRRALLGMVTPPGCGKSAIANADRASLGDYAGTIRSEALQIPGRFQRGGNSHNGDLLQFARPRRIVYAPDCLGQLDLHLLNLLSGGDELAARDVGEKVKVIRPSAHLILQANPPEAGGRFLGLDEQSGTADAFRERLRMLPLSPIPADKRKPQYVHLASDSREFREAWLARSVRQAMRFLDKHGQRAGPPVETATMAQAVEQLAAHEAPAWQREWLQVVMVKGPGFIDSHDLYTDYLKWNEEYGESNKQASRREIIAAINNRAGEGKKERITKDGTRREVTVWTGWEKT